jgi:hypothetical protein
MKKIGKVKLSADKDLRIVVTADVHMDSEDDIDDLYFVLFNIMAEPLRLSIAVVGNFFQRLHDLEGLTKDQCEKLLKSNPQQYMNLIQKHYATIITEHAVEKVKLPLDSQAQADKVRMILTSLLSQKSYHQINRYIIPSEPAPIIRTQDIDTTALSSELRVMLDIVKRWETFDLEEYVAEMTSQV